MLRLAALRFSRFSCLAADCRENCCTGLRVELTEDNHRTLTEKAAGHPTLAPMVERLVQIEPRAAQTQRAFASIDAKGKSCPFLDTSWLCSLHGALGEEALSDPCSLFPRVLTEVEGTLELSATFACPEAARLCLTGEDALDAVPFSPHDVPREIVVRRHPASTTDPYQALFSTVRQLCLDVMSARDVRWEVGLLVLLDFAAAVEDFFHQGTERFDAVRWDAAVRGVPSRVAALEALLVETPPQAPSALRALQEIFLARLPNCDNRRFQAWVRPAVLAAPEAPLAEVARYFHGRPDVGLPIAEVAARTAAARAQLAPWSARMDEHARRFAQNALVKDWYTQHPTLSQALAQLVLKLSLSRFLLFAAWPPLAGESRASLDDASVNAFQIVAKNIEHVPSFLALCERSLAEKGLVTLPGMASLLRA